MVRIPTDLISSVSFQRLRVRPYNTEITINYQDGVRIKVTVNMAIARLLGRRSHQQIADKLKEYCETSGVRPDVDISSVLDATPNQQMLRTLERYDMTQGTATARVQGIDFGRATDNIAIGQAVRAGNDGTITAATTTRGLWHGLTTMAILDDVYFGGSNQRGNPNKIKYPEMDCACCSCKLDQPQNIGNLLSQEDIDKYVKLCAELKQAPQLYCCACFEIVKQTPKMLDVWKTLIKDYRGLADIRSQTNADQNKVTAMMKQLDENSDIVNNKLDELKRQTNQLRKNPLRLVLAEICKERYQNIKPKGLEWFNDYDLESQGVNFMMKAEATRKIGQVLIIDPTIACFRFGYQRLWVSLQPEEMTASFHIGVPIPFMKKSHGIQWRMWQTLRKKLRFY